MKKILTAALLLPALAMAQSQNQNYVKTTIYTDTDTTDIVKRRVNVTYFDGLGRPIQQVASKQSSEGKDIVTHIEYDAFGRQALDFLPYPSDAGTMAFTDPSAAKQAALNHYQTAYGDASPFSEKRFEASPLNRVLQQAAPGNAWALGVPGQADHSVKTAYEANTAADGVKLYKAVAGAVARGVYPTTLTQQGNYAPVQLYKTVTKDENWASGKAHTSEEFKDKEGRVILKRTYGESVIGNNILFTAHDTYYIYDQYGNLSYVLPPISDGSGSLQDLNGTCYQYRYDYRNRLVEKKLPGKQWEFIVYDNLDRVVATGIATSPFPDNYQSIQGWLVTKYDSFNRPILTGWFAMAYTPNNRFILQSTLQAQTENFSESRSSSGSSVNGIYFQYTNNSWPANMHVLTVNYYDDYDFPGAPQTIPSSVAAGNQPVYYNSSVKPMGLLTGGWTRALEGIASYRGASYYMLYDSKGRQVRDYSTNYLGGYAQKDKRMDFSGKILSTITEHKRIPSDVTLAVREYFDYTDQDRLLTHTHQINGRSAELLTRNEYDKLGQLKRKSIGGPYISGGGALQKVDYGYNIRGWLNGINTANPEPNDPADLFVFELKYDAPESAQALFNGNISESYWKTASDMVKRKYNYTYDDLNRLRGASYQKASQNYVATHAYNEAMQYDRNGNITHLWRNGNNDGPVPLEIDNLGYSYDTQNPNKLMRVTDGSLDPVGFRDGSNTGDDYAYDGHGNMTSDANKGISEIRYNHLNLPMTIFFGSEYGKIEYIYGADGKKLKKTVRKSNLMAQGGYVERTMDYLGGYQYDNGELMFFSTAEGYVSHVSGQFNYVYNYTDHLGNVRVSYGLDPQTQAVKIIEENHYYPFGMKHASYNVDRLAYQEKERAVVLKAAPVASGIAFKYNYKYNGKEFQDELGLNLYDYGARNYDPAIGRWMNIDPLAEVSRRFSPYTYALNNPVYFIDPDGMMAIGNDDNDDVITKVSNTKRSGKNVQRDISITVTLSIVAGKNDDLSKTQFNKKSGSIRLTNFEGNAQFYLEGAELMSNDNVTSVNVNYKVVNSLDDVGQDDHVMMLVDAIPKDFGKALDPQGKAEVGGRVSAVERRTLGDGTFNQVSQHELGHNLGMNHSPDGTGLMGATVNGSTTSKVRRGEMVNNELVMTSGNGTYKQSSRNTTYKTPIKNQANNFIKQNRIKK